MYIKGHSQQSEKITDEVGGNISQQSNQQGINSQNIHKLMQLSIKKKKVSNQ